MLSIQQVGKEILSGMPKKFYLFFGSEYGIKNRYLDTLSKLYQGRKVEASSVSSVLSMMNTKHLIPLAPSLYVVRYDDTFISSISDRTKSLVEGCNIVGTLVCLYDSEKQCTKCDKYLPNNVVVIDPVNSSLVSKYLSSDFPEVNNRFISIVASCCSDYGKAYNMCNSISYSNQSMLDKLDDGEIAKLFGYSYQSSEEQIKLGVASRNFAYLVSILDSYPNPGDAFLYSMLSAMLELEKLSSNPRASSSLRPYSKNWTPQSIYNMFCQIYSTIVLSRTSSGVDIYHLIIYLFSLLQFSTVPSEGDLNI